MAASSLTGVTPTLCNPDLPKYNVLVTQSESMLKNYINLSGSSPTFVFRLKFKNVSDADHDLLLSHWMETKGGAESFTWKTVPPYIDGNHDGVADGENMTGHWVHKSFKHKPNPHSWDVDLKFEAI